jgi:NAD(P)-dependent dehydrogenase (short-subunit alcohol dehydrogenase family)
MNGAFLDKLQVLVTGVDTAIARDVVRLVAAEGASVIAADKDATRLARLDRDVGLFRAHVETAAIDLASTSEVRLWEGSLRAFARLPHLMICCCGAAPCPSEPIGPTRRRAIRPGGRVNPGLADVALSEHEGRDCPALIARRVLQPTLFLHAEPLRRSAFNRALSVLRHPTLRGVLERAPGRGVFNPETAIPYVRIASRLYSLRRHADGDTAPQGRLRLTSAARRADAA